MDWINIHTERYTPDGEFLKTRLELEGIPCRLLNEYGNMMVYNTSGVVIQVEPSNVHDALTLLVKWDYLPEMPKQRSTFLSKLEQNIRAGKLSDWTSNIFLLNRFKSPANRLLVLVSLVLLLVFLAVQLVESLQ